MVVGTQSSPLVISESGHGNDLFLYWVSDCHGSQNLSGLEFDFVKGTSVHEQSRADFCKVRFQQKLYTKMYALSNHMEPPGVVIYDSDKRKEIEYSNPINYSALGREFLYRHPEYQEMYERYNGNDNSPLYDYPDYGHSDMASHYDDYRLQGALNSPSDVRLPSNNLPPLDQNDYAFDDRSNLPLYSSLYSPQNYENVANHFRYPSEYYGDVLRSNNNNKLRYPSAQRKVWPQQNTAFVNRISSVNPQLYQAYRSNTRNNYRNNDGRLAVHKRSNVYEKLAPQNHVYQKNLKHGKKIQVRHVGPHDGGGIQRVISTGTLAPTLKTKGKHGIDVLFATFWFFPSSVQSLLPEDKECITEGMHQEEQRFKVSNQYYGMDHDAYEEVITKECLRKSGHLKTGKHQNEYNPFNRPMGQLTLYRVHINCRCVRNSTKGQHCSKILPFNQQGWPSYMGRFGNSAAIPRD